MIRKRVLWVLTIFVVKSAICSESIPTYHWVYDYVDQLQVSGYLKDFYITTKPYSRIQVAGALVKLDSLMAQRQINMTQEDLLLVEKLRDEFSVEMTRLHSSSNTSAVKLGVWNDSNQSVGQEEQSFDYYLKSIISLSLTKNLTFFNSVKLDNRLGDDPDYVGRNWRNLTAFTEQAYARFRYRNFDFVLGRDFVKWGPGKSGNLLFSDHSRPMDLFGFSASLKYIKFSYFGARLDHRSTQTLGVVSEYDDYMKRYLTAHRVDFKFKQKLFIGFTETLLYANPGEGIEIQYHNPFMYYHGELLNKGGSDGNGLLSIDVDYFPWKNWEIYGELMIDDIQIENSTPTDLEPTEYGLMLGFQKSNVFGMLVGMEYTRVSNWTYNSEKPWERFLHRNEPIGYLTGNDFDRWMFWVKSWTSENTCLHYGMEYLRKGEGRITDEWTEPWMQRTIEEGYSEKFPLGVVEKMFRPWVRARYHHNNHLWLDAKLLYCTIENYNHLENKTRNEFQFEVNFWLNLNTTIFLEK